MKIIYVLGSKKKLWSLFAVVSKGKTLRTTARGQFECGYSNWTCMYYISTTQIPHSCWFCPENHMSDFWNCPAMHVCFLEGNHYICASLFFDVIPGWLLRCPSDQTLLNEIHDFCTAVCTWLAVKLLPRWRHHNENPVLNGSWCKWVSMYFRCPY